MADRRRPRAPIARLPPPDRGRRRQGLGAHGSRPRRRDRRCPADRRQCHGALWPRGAHPLRPNPRGEPPRAGRGRRLGYPRDRRASGRRGRARLAGRIADTPKPGDAVFERTVVAVVGSNLLACEAAARAASSMGFQVLVLTTYVEGEAREVGRVLAGLLREIDASGHPVARPCCVIAGGETTVTVRGSGQGGRNQELALSAAFALL